MKLSVLTLALTVASAPLLAVETGYTYKQVVEEKGVPTSKIEAGDMQVLHYPDSTIKLREGKVIEIKGAGTGAPAPSSGTAISAGEWTTDYAAALLQAKTDKKRVFLFFTGSDWCGWCKRLDKEILSTADFKAYAKKSLILVKLDFPHSIPQPAQVTARNQKLARQYGIQGYPTIIVLNGAGENVGQLGYQDGGPKPFIKELKKL